MMTSAIETEVNEVVSLRERLDVFTRKAAEFKKDKEKLVRPLSGPTRGDLPRNVPTSSSLLRAALRTPILSYHCP